MVWSCLRLDLHLRMITLVTMWEQDWRRYNSRWGEGHRYHRHSWANIPQPFQYDDLKTHLAPLLPPQASGTSGRVAWVFFGSYDVLRWCILPPSPRAPLSRTTDNLMEMLLENLHQEICSSLVQLPSLPCSSENSSGETRTWEPR